MVLGLVLHRSFALDVSLSHLQQYGANLGASNMAGRSVLSNCEHRLTLLYNLIGLLLFLSLLSRMYLGYIKLLKQKANLAPALDTNLAKLTKLTVNQFTLLWKLGAIIWIAAIVVGVSDKITGSQNFSR
ncbi:hypothetical protein VCRA2122O12_180051 [Vibrio crassostreae]|nr:hypothetical protein VCRA2110O4_180051 [Vibrio crassostreae]CAK2606222.1 hypothetical protein VCRA2110O3_180053 [Vibrio crassostreae]CAK3239643.1 hypothetical protein VCRA2122O11_170051 [Vibrio crassostreae]CAK3244028.1 hypothetical protein VCRA2122O12_180051 [Vibrio crassostreae]CAK3764338.1 hypothetical protein VCRA2120E8_170052 [Vibrio crassostreae]